MADEVTLDYVARKAGVSRATASRALNDRPGVNDDVRDRVKMIAESLQYRPNRAAQNLAGGRTRVVGLVLGGFELQTDLYASSLVQAVAAAADHYDEGLMLLLARREPGRAVQNLLRDGLVDGVVVTTVAMEERWVQELLDTSLPKVLLGPQPGFGNLPSVDVENFESSAAIVGHLLDTGCERVGMVTGEIERQDAQLRIEGFRKAHELRGIDVDESLIREGTFLRLSGYEVADSLIDAGVDGVFASNDEMALGFLRALGERNLACPDDISVVGFDGTSLIGRIGVRVSSVLQPFDELGMAAMGMLIDLLNKKELEDRNVLVPPTLSLGETTRRVS